MKKVIQTVHRQAMTIVVLLFIAFAVLAQVANAQEQPQDLNKSRTTILLNTERLNIADYLRFAENSILEITKVAGMVPKLQEQNDSLQAELAKLKPKKKE